MLERQARYAAGASVSKAKQVGRAPAGGKSGMFFLKNDNADLRNDADWVKLLP
jgi:hypothetical protein